MKYAHGGDIYSAKRQMPEKRIIDFSANINPLGLSGSIMQAIIDAIPMITGYPDPYNVELSEAIAQYEGIKSGNIVCGNGAADLIFSMAITFKPKKAMLLSPTFSEYELALKASGSDITYYKLHKNSMFKVKEDLLNAISEDIGMIFLCNPNNPTGGIIEKSLMKKIVEKCDKLGVVCVIDECFMGFVIDREYFSAKNMLGEHKNLIILKAFTKLFAMPGIRLGYLMTSSSDFIERIISCSQSWSVSTLAQAAGTAALKDKDFPEITRRYVALQRQYLTDELKDLGFTVFEAYANFILFQTSEAVVYKDKLYEKGILIRSCENFLTLDETYLRTAVRTKEENQLLIKALAQIKAEL